MFHRRRDAAGRDDLESAKFAIDQTAGWIRHADAKIAILATASGVILGFLVAAIPAAVTVIHAHSAWTGTVAALCLASLASAVLTTIFVAQAIVARTDSTYPDNRFSWPDLAIRGWPEQAGSAPLDAQQQAVQLAKVARLKFRNFNRAFCCFIVLLSVSAATIISIGIANA